MRPSFSEPAADGGEFVREARRRQLQYRVNLVAEKLNTSKWYSHDRQPYSEQHWGVLSPPAGDYSVGHAVLDSCHGDALSPGLTHEFCLRYAAPVPLAGIRRVYHFWPTLRTAKLLPSALVGGGQWRYIVPVLVAGLLPGLDP